MQIRSNLQKTFDDSIREEVRSLINIADIVGRHVALKPAGQNFKGLCPFHKEKSPSFTVSPAKGIFYCFGCHKGGDVFSFLMELEGLTFPEALRSLADEAGVKMQPEKQKRPIADYDSYDMAPDPEAEAGDAPGGVISKTELFAINELALDFFYHQTRSHKPAIDYFLSRGLSRETIRDFKLGYAPEGWTAFLDYAKSKRISQAAVIAAGLAIVKQETGRAYDRFRDRIMFPIFDTSKRPVGFAGRGLTKDAMPKYLNSPETPLYQKSKLLYGFHVTNGPIREKKSVIIVEGYMDFLSLYQAGIKNVIATSGTAFTDMHARTLRRFTSTVYLVFDGDSAGIMAAQRAITVLAPYNFDIRVLTIPNDEDPDDFIKEKGGQAFTDLLQTAQSYMGFIIAKTISDHKAYTPFGKSAAVTALAPLIHATTDTVVKQDFLRQISEAMNLPLDTIQKQMRQTASTPVQEEKRLDNSVKEYFGSMEGTFLWILLTNPDLIADARPYILPETFTDHFSTELYSILLNAYDDNPDLSTLLGKLSDEGTKRMISYAYAHQPPVTNARDDLFHFMKRLQVKYLLFMEQKTREQMVKEPLNRAVLLTKINEYITQRKALADN